MRPRDNDVLVLRTGRDESAGNDPLAMLDAWHDSLSFLPGTCRTACAGRAGKGGALPPPVMLCSRLDEIPAIRGHDLVVPGLAANDHIRVFLLFAEALDLALLIVERVRRARGQERRVRSHVADEHMVAPNVGDDGSRTVSRRVFDGRAD